MWKYLCLGLLSGLLSCNSSVKSDSHTNVADHKKDQNRAISAYFDSSFNENIKLYPVRASILGNRIHQDSWDDLSEAFQKEEMELAKAEQEKFHARFHIDALNQQNQISYKLFDRSFTKIIEGYKWRYHNYPVNQESGLHADAPTFLINVHQITDKKDALAYISRLKKIKPLFAELVRGLETRANMGIIVPKFAFPKMLGSCKNIIVGKPFDQTSKNSDLLADFISKINNPEVKIPTSAKNQLIAEATSALKDSVLPAYKSLMSYLTQLEKRASTDAGCWKFPQGDEFYRYAVKNETTTNLTPEEVYELGVKEVNRIHDEMHAIMKQVHFKNDNLKDFLHFVTTDKQFYYPNTPAGGKQYLQQAQQYIDAMTARLDEIFITKPRAKLVVMPVEKFRESSAGGAFYEEPSPDGTRPGRFYANLSDMSIMPIYQLEALAYHEGIPGHHMQIAIAQELKGVPAFQRFDGYTAYAEGWGLYTERLGKEMGFYKDPYQDFGRLSMELLRAARLVVDPGLHSKKWTREKAIKYFEDNTAEPAGECIKAIERYTVWPGQATAYKVGMIKIQQLREKAQKALGDKYSIREFHEAILTCASVPLDVLEEVVDDYIAQKQKLN